MNLKKTSVNEKCSQENQVVCFGCKKTEHLKKDCKNFLGDKWIPSGHCLSYGNGMH